MADFGHFKIKIVFVHPKKIIFFVIYENPLTFKLQRKDKI